MRSNIERRSTPLFIDGALQGFVDAGLSASAGGLEVVEDFFGEAQGDELLGLCLLGAAFAGTNGDKAKTTAFFPICCDSGIIVRVVWAVVRIVPYNHCFIVDTI